VALLCALGLVAGSVARAQDAGSPSTQEADGGGTVGGQVFDRESGDPVADVTVVLIWPDPGDGSAPEQRVTTTDADGAYRFESVPPGSYSLSFVKSGYRASKMTRFEVEEGAFNRADFPLQQAAIETSDSVLELEAFVVEAEVVEDIMSELELRMDSDQLLNILSAEEFSKFAASDVADALKRVSGVNVVEGQFAIIRGLEDRYSSVLYNGAPVPSPDPDRQSVQLDLFPSDVVSNLLVTKTMAPHLPSNSSGGNIDIETLGQAESFVFKLSAGTGFEEGADERFLSFVDGNPAGEEDDDILESDFSGVLGGRREFFGREVRLKAVASREIDYATAEGFQEERQPRLPQVGPGGIAVNPNPPPPLILLPGELLRSGGLSLGELALSAGRWDLTESLREKQITGYLGIGLDLDEEGNHKVDGSVFYTKKEEETVQLRENGYWPDVDYAEVLEAQFDNSFDGLDLRNNDFLEPFVTLRSPLYGQMIDDLFGSIPQNGVPAYSAFFRTQSFARERELELYQINGDHEFGLLPGLHLAWALNRAKTQQEDESLGFLGYYLPGSDNVVELTNEFLAMDRPLSGPFGVSDLPACGPDSIDCGFSSGNDITFSSNFIEEEQDFARVDLDYERPFLDWLRVEVSGGGWYEKSERSVDAKFLPAGSAQQDSNTNQFRIPGPGTCGPSPFPPCADSLVEVGDFIFGGERGLDLDDDDLPLGTSQTTSLASREIVAWYVGSKLSFFEKIDVLGGVRVEDIQIESINDPFFGPEEPPFLGGPRTFPSRFVLFDRFDNVVLNEVSEFDPDRVHNDQILGIDVPTAPCPDAPGTPLDESQFECVDIQSDDEFRALVNGEIDERFYLPSVGLTVRPLDGMTLRGAWSKTVARPSFREIGYYVTVEPGSDDQIVGNPQLGLSRVESWDARFEYVWGDRGDLVAVSWFKKSIEDPIESIVVRDEVNQEASSLALFRTFFNNPNEASLTGLEGEFRKDFGFVGTGLRWLGRRLGWEIGGLGFLDYLSVGGNYTWIDASVKRSEFERARFAAFFGLAEGDVERFTEYEEERRLFSQPEWIANANISFDHEEWGTKITLAYFAISDVLDAAGTAGQDRDGEIRSATLDRYVDSFEQLDLVASQKLRFETFLPNEWRIPGALSFKMSIKNLTDSRRQIIYDDAQTSQEIAERSFRLGRDYSFSIAYEIEFD